VVSARVAGLGLLALLAVACGGDDDAASAGEQYRNLLPYDTARVRVATAADTTTLVVELAESGEQQTLGLMERRALADSAGMLFVYPATQPATSAFWMFRTRIPLDIAFVDSAGVIRSIVAMEPCASDLAAGCPSYPANAPYRAALEVNRGWFARRGVRVGDRLLLGDTSTRRRAAGGR
jgi:uncharacterized protein